MIFSSSNCENIQQEEVLTDNVLNMKNVEFVHNLIYNNNVAQKLTDISESITAIKNILVNQGLVILDNDIEGLSVTQILPEKGEKNMARIRGRINLNHETVMVSAVSVQALIEKVTSIVLENVKQENASPIKHIPTFKEYASDWMEKYCKNKVDKTTFVGYQSYLRAQLYNAFGSLRLDEITVNKLQEFINSHKNYSVKSLKNYMKLLSLILQSAIEDQYITTDVTKSKKIVYPNKEPKERIPLTEEQMKNILSNIHKLEPIDQLFLALLLFTGARRGEIIGLKAMDIDRDKMLIHLRRQVRYPGTNQGEIVDYLKMHKKKGRDIPILDQLLPYLPNDNEDRLLFGDGVNPWSGQQFRNTWTRINKTINLYDATAHVLRHTFLTYANNHGADPKTLQTLAGHASAQFTLSQYVHSQTEQLQRIGSIISNELEKL